MIIYRDGQAIELTREELRKAYDELDREYKAEDIRDQLETMEIELDITDELIQWFEDTLSNDDGYWDSYWLDAKYAIEDYLKEKGLR